MFGRTLNKTIYNPPMRINRKYKEKVFEINEESHQLIMKGKAKVRLIPNDACKYYFFTRFNVSGDFIGEGTMLSIDDNGGYFYFGSKDETNLPEISINDLVTEKVVEKTIPYDAKFLEWAHYRICKIFGK